MRVQNFAEGVQFSQGVQTSLRGLRTPAGAGYVSTLYWVRYTEYAILSTENGVLIIENGILRTVKWSNEYYVRYTEY